MDQVLGQIAVCVERGKINMASPFPPDLAGQNGAEELTQSALDAGLSAEEILNQGLIVGMQKIGEKFRNNEAFVPDVLLAAKAMNAAMKLLEPLFKADANRFKGTLVMGTVAGDLHDIGKNLASMIIQGAGWKVVDMGVDVSTEKFLDAIKANEGCVVGMSALLTTTMANMEQTVRAIKEASPATKVIVGGAPLSQEFADKVGADCYCPDPQRGAEFLESLSAGA
ncbi:cobalamin-dependent protein [Candidatus Sumerlaeota bacterium]|nr:cobalamin-dependent protein [Candidatus Sumerlaeota bacterium]